MLSVPEYVKNGLLDGTAFREYKIHFPNGECRDLGIEDLESEGVSLSENLCSADILKFGNIENNSITFSALNIPNIKGCKIVVVLNILCEGYDVYEIPMGTFIVDSCKRNSVYVNARKITAYSENYNNPLSAGNMFDFLEGYSWSSAETLKLTDEDIICVYDSSYADSKITNTRTYNYQKHSSYPLEYKINRVTAPDGTIYDLYVRCERLDALFNMSLLQNDAGARLYRIKSDRFSIDDVISAFEQSPVPRELYDGYLAPYIRTTIVKKGFVSFSSSYTEYTEDISSYRNFPTSLDDTILVKNQYDTSGNKYYFQFGTDPYGYNDIATYSPFIVVGYRVNKVGYDSTYLLVNCANMPESYTVGWLELGKTGRVIFNQKSTKVTLTVTQETSAGKKTQTTRTDYKFDISQLKQSYESIIKSYYEVKAQLVMPNRLGELVGKTLSRNPVYTLDASSIGDIWLDDGGTKPYGRVSCNWRKDSSTTVYLYHDIVANFNNEDYIDYDLSNNYFITSGLLPKEDINNILIEMGSLLKNIRYVPANISCLGLPFLEPGDCINIQTTYGEQYLTYILSRKLSGLFMLQDDITADANEDYVSVSFEGVSSAISGSAGDTAVIQEQIQALENNKVSTSFTINNMPMSGTALNITASNVGAVPEGGNISSLMNDANYATKSEVQKAVDDLPKPMIFKGSLGVGGTITSLPAPSAANEGFTYKVITDGTYRGIDAKVGDQFISKVTEWVHIPSGDEPSGTVTSVKIEAEEGIEVSGDNPITTSGIIKIKNTAIASEMSSEDLTRIFNSVFK